jgi:hypothetical protein
MVLDNFPPDNCAEREQMILDSVINGTATFGFTTITSEYNGHQATFYVFEDALKLEGVRLNVSARNMQKIADLLYCILPTPRLYDLMWYQCPAKIEPQPRSITSSTAAMIDYSKVVDAELAKANCPDGVVKSTIGKIWVVDNSMQGSQMACNYGWHFIKGNNYKGISGDVNQSFLKNPSTGQYYYMIQSTGHAHDASHIDYSQICILVSRHCVVDGKDMDILDVLTDSLLSPLANNGGILKVLRQPGIEELQPLPTAPYLPKPPQTFPETESPTLPSEQTPVEIPIEVGTPENGTEVIAKQPVVASLGFVAIIISIIKFILSFFRK